MRKLIILASFLTLGGCSLFAIRYDANEYRIISEIRAHAILAKENCNDKIASAKESEEIYKQIILFVTYTQYLPKNQNINNSAKELEKISLGLKNAYHNEVSETFCKLKFENIENVAELIQQGAGGKPR